MHSLIREVRRRVHLHRFNSRDLESSKVDNKICNKYIDWSKKGIDQSGGLYLEGKYSSL